MTLRLVIILVVSTRLAAATPVVVDSARARLGATIAGPRNPKSIVLRDGARSAVAISVHPRMEPIAIALVISTWPQWIGMNEAPSDPPRPAWQQPGALNPLKQAIDESGLATMGAPGSQCVIVRHALDGGRALIRVTLDNLRGDLLGVQRDYVGPHDVDVIKAVHIALDELREIDTPHKALIVFGDGFATGALPVSGVVPRFENEHVTPLAVLWRPPHAKDLYRDMYRDAPEDILAIVPEPIRTTLDDMTAAVREVIDQLPSDLEVVFDASTLYWDGRVHDLELVVDGKSLGVRSVRLARPIVVTSKPVWIDRKSVV